MELDRRRVLAALAGAGFVAPFVPIAALARAAGSPAFVAARQDPDGTHAAVVLDIDGTILFTETIPTRGHAVAITLDGRTAVLFARRPGRFALVLDLAQRKPAYAFAPPENRHAYGHGFFTPDGHLLYATENDFDGERGVLGVYDVAAGYRRIGEVDTHGIGPHEAVLMSDGRTIAVANGGIATHPDFPRMKLNLSTMAPSLAYLDLATGDPVDRATLPRSLARLSLRHLAEAADGSVWFGGQYEGPRTDEVPLVGHHRPGEALTFADAPSALYRDMNRYVGSVAASRDRHRIAVSSPRGGLLAEFDATSGNVRAVRRIADVCGLAPRRAAFLASDGEGRLWADGEDALAEAGGRWDNHITAVHN